MLSMSGNYVGGLGASALANGMISNEGIKGLMLNGNDIGNIGQSKFAWFHSVLQAVFFFFPKTCHARNHRNIFICMYVPFILALSRSAAHYLLAKQSCRILT